MFESIIDLLWSIFISYTVIHYWYYAYFAQKPVWPFTGNPIKTFINWLRK